MIYAVIIGIVILIIVLFFIIKKIKKSKKKEPVIPTYTIKFVTNCEEVLEDITLKEHEILPKLPVVKKIGYNFKGWYMDENFETTVNKKLEIEEDITLYAKFEELTIEEFLAELDTTNIEKDILKKVRKSYKEENDK